MLGNWAWSFKMQYHKYLTDIKSYVGIELTDMKSNTLINFLLNRQAIWINKAPPFLEIEKNHNKQYVVLEINPYISIGYRSWIFQLCNIHNSGMLMLLRITHRLHSDHANNLSIVLLR